MSSPVNTILVTGVGGFIGKNIAQSSANQGKHVYGLYRNTFPTELSKNKQITLIKGNLDNCNELPVDYDAVIHCAAEIPANCENEEKLYNSNIKGTQKLFEHAMSINANRIIYCSSMSIYGNINDDIVTEETSINQPDMYGKSKLEGEILLTKLANANSDLRALSIRLPGIVGKNSKNNFLSNILPEIIRGNLIRVTNPDNLFNNIIHIDDLALFYCKVIDKLNLGHTITNIASINPITIREVISILFSTAQQKENVNYSIGNHSFVINPESAISLGYDAITTKQSLINFVNSNIHNK